jgi:hypothetical protein
MDFLREGASPEFIAAELDLTGEQVGVALAYIAAHQKEVEEAYQAVLRRVSQANSTQVDAGRARTPEELKHRIQARSSRELSHVDSPRQ